MFTVVICGNPLIRSIQNNHSHILDMLLRQKDCAICAWNPEAATLEEAVPGLDELTAGHGAWRAVIVQESETFGYECIDRRNPFDAVGSVKALSAFGEETILSLLEEQTVDDSAAIAEQINGHIQESARRIDAFRQAKKNNYTAAVQNPLTRLAIWLLGSPMPLAPETAPGWPEELLAEDCTVDRAYYDRLTACGILPAELEQVRAYRYKYAALSQHFAAGAMLKNKPDSVLVVGERLGERADDIFTHTREQHEELEYDNFCDDNLYPDKLRFVLYDVNHENQNRNPSDYLAFLSFLYMVVCHEIPYGTLQAQRVYRGDARIDREKAQRFFTRYLRKLEMTKRVLISHLRRREYITIEEALTPEEAIGLFESDTIIPVEIRNGTITRDFMAAYRIGLSKNCPRDEYDYWYEQITDITKKFIRYLREPRRALKHAVKYDFRDKAAILDERILQLTEEQMEDIGYRLLEEEQKMVETTTTQLFQTKEYTDRIDEADQEIRNYIFKRMTHRKTLCTAAIALGAFLFGFTPLLLDHIKSPKTVLTALLLTGISVGLLAAIGVIFLLVVRKRLINRFIHFNKVMGGILQDIENGLQAFSRYLGHACNVMREFSVCNYRSRTIDMKRNILKKHISDIQRKIDGINDLFADCADLRRLGNDDIRPYNFDFSQPVDYVYDIPYEDTNSEVEFIRKDNRVLVPIDYVKSITLTREELYD